MANRVLLLTKNLEIFIEFNTFFNEEGWIIQNVMGPAEVQTILKEKKITAIFWDMDVLQDYQQDIALIKQVRQDFRRPIFALTTKTDPEHAYELYTQALINGYFCKPLDYRLIFAQLLQQLWFAGDKLITANLTAETAPKRGYYLEHLLIDRDHYRVTHNGTDIGLTPKEFRLLWYLIKHHNQVLSREQLLQGVWGYDTLGSSRIVDMHISHLRDKIEVDPDHPRWIKTVRGFGYSFEGPLKKL